MADSAELEELHFPQYWHWRSPLLQVEVKLLEVNYRSLLHQIFLVHTHLQIYTDTKTDCFTLLACVHG